MRATALAESLEDLEAKLAAIGARLHAISRHGRTIDSLAAEILETLGSEALRGFPAAARSHLRVLEECQVQLIDSLGLYGEGAAGFSPLLQGLRRDLDEIEDLAKDLWMLSISTRVYSAGIASDGEFAALAADLASLSRAGRERAISARRAADTMEALTSRREAGRRTAGSGNLADLRTVLGEMVARTGEFERTLEAALESGRRLSDWPREASGIVDGLIVSFQYHDIIRQRLAGIVGAQAAGTGGAAGPESFSSAELESIGRGINTMLCSVVKSLQDLSETVIERTSQFRRAIRPGSSFLPSLAALADQAETLMNAEISGDIAAVDAMQELEAVAGRTLDAVGDPESATDDLSLLAVNARISAVRSGAAGGGLGEIASAIQELAHRERHGHRDVRGRIARIQGHAAGTATGLDAQLAHCGRTREEVLGVLRPLLSTAGSQLGRLGELDERLADASLGMVNEIAELLRHFGDVSNAKLRFLEAVGTMGEGPSAAGGPMPTEPSASRDAGGSVELL